MENQNNENTTRQVDLLDVLLDQDNKEPIVLMDENGKQMTFEQVAVIPYEVRKEKRLYCVLKPLDKIEGIGDDEAIVFLVDTDDEGNSIIRIEEDEEIAIAVFDKYYDLLMVMAGSVVYVGELGAGNVAKLANQIVVAVNIAAVSEALTFAKKAGADPELVYQAIRGGLAGSTVMDAKAPMMLERNFKPGFRIELHIKDLNNALNAAHAISSPVPLTAQLMEMMQFLKSEGCDKEDHSSIVKYYEKIAGVTVES